MLVLARNSGEALTIGDEIIIRVLDVDKRRSRVKIGIEVPEPVKVRRDKLYNRINAPCKA